MSRRLDPHSNISTSRVLGYQLHPLCSLRRENVIRINNSNHPFPIPSQFTYIHNSTLAASVCRTFPDGANILWSIVLRFLAQPNFSHPCLSPRCRKAWGMLIHQFHKLEHACSIKTLCIEKFQTTVFYHLICSNEFIFLIKKNFT